MTTDRAIDSVSTTAYRDPMQTFTKLFSTLIHSTVWREEMHVKVVWITMLAMADSRGRVFASVPGLADASRVSMPQCLEALTRFRSPDEWSRTKEFEGRRIEDIDGGWQLLTYAKHRNEIQADERREQTRVAVARHRAKKKADVSNVTDYGSSSSSSVVAVEKGQEAVQERITTFLGAWDFGPWANAVEGLIRLSNSPAGIIAELGLYLTGDRMNAPQPSPAVLGIAVHEYLISTNSGPFNALHFAGFVRRGHAAKRAHTETRRIEAEKGEAKVREREEQDEALRRRTAVEHFERDHPERYAEIAAQAEREVPAEQRRGRGVYVRARIIELVSEEVDRAGS